MTGAEVAGVPVAVVPGVLALLPGYASLEDPVAELRAACHTAAAGLGPRVQVVASGRSGRRVGEALVAAVGAEVAGVAGVAEGAGGGAGGFAGEATGVLVVGNGSAKRTEKAPGHLDDRAAGFDAALGEDLRAGTVDLDPARLALAEELQADVGAFAVLTGCGAPTRILYDDAPFGVAYWVLAWD